MSKVQIKSIKSQSFGKIPSRSMGDICKWKLFITHYFTNSNPDQAHASCTRARAGAQCKDHGGGVGRDGGGGRDGAGAGGEIVGRGILFR